MKNLKITQITTVHPRYDSRIFVKECTSLAKEYKEVNLIVADGKGDEVINGVNIYDLSKPKNRLERIRKFKKLAFEKAMELNSDIYHFHDPELISTGVKLKKKGKKVVYDVHEDVPRQILRKSYLKGISKKIISSLFEVYENGKAEKFSGIVTSTNHIRDRFLRTNTNTISIKNYSVKEEFSKINESYTDRENNITYVGGITKSRGIVQIIDALGHTKNDVKLILAGTFHNNEFKEEIEKHPNWCKVKYLGCLSREGVIKVLSESKLGMVTLLPLESYMTSLPIKMFEYMMAKIPVIASNFEFWRELFTEKEVFFVNPEDSKEIANAIDLILEDQQMAQKMIRKCYLKVENEMNWELEAQKLFEFYTKL